MAIDLFPLLKCLQVGSYDNCVILTYTADLYFFEQVVWSTLRARSCFNTVVMMDGRQYGAALESTGALLNHLGKSYSVWPVPAAKAFHPKLILQTSEKEARLIIGSGNLTVRGFSTNWEVFSEISHGREPAARSIVAAAWNLITESAKGATSAVRRQLEQMKATSGSLLEADRSTEWPRVLYSAPGQPSLLSQLKSVVGSAKVRRLIIVSPFFDSQLRGIRELQKALGVEEIKAVIQSESVSFPGKAAGAIKSLAVHEFVPPRQSKSGYLHAKAYIFQTQTTEYCVWGSANCSVSALGEQGNYEAVLVMKGKPGDAIEELGLRESLIEGQLINPSRLTLRETSSEQAETGLRIIGAEVSRCKISVLVASAATVSACKEGKLELWGRAGSLPDVTVSRTDETAFVGRLTQVPGTGSLFCRLVLPGKSGGQKSQALAVHFLEDLEKATPTRIQARMHRVVQAIHSGAFDWAKGLENVCELVMKIGIHDDLESAGHVSARMRRIMKGKPPSENNESKGVGFYDDFLSDDGDVSASANEHSVDNPLAEIVTTLRAQLLRGVEKGEDDVDQQNDRDAWRYQEETEQDAAEAGASSTPSGDPTEQAIEHSRVHRGYIRLMKGLAERFNFLCRGKKALNFNDLWRLEAVNLLLLDGCGRRLPAAGDLGPVLSPEDLFHEYLPAAAVSLGRTHRVDEPGTQNGPLPDGAELDHNDAGVRSSLQSTCLLLTCLATHDRRRGARAFNDDSLQEWQHYTEIVVVRCFATLIRRKLLPSLEEIAALAGHGNWPSSLGLDLLADVYIDLDRLARSVVRCEDQFSAAAVSHSPQDLTPGEWIWAPCSGITEIVRVADSQVEIARIGEPNAEEWFHTTDSRNVLRSHIPPKVRIRAANVAEELNHLLAYSDEDFEEWRDTVTAQLARGYKISLENIVAKATSMLLRNAAARQLELNLRGTNR